MNIHNARFGWLKCHNPLYAREALRMEGIDPTIRNLAGELQGWMGLGCVKRAMVTHMGRRDDPWLEPNAIDLASEYGYLGYTCIPKYDFPLKVVQRRHDRRLYLDSFFPPAGNPSEWLKICRGGPDALPRAMLPYLKEVRMVPEKIKNLSIWELISIIWRDTPPLTFAILWDISNEFRQGALRMGFLPADARITPRGLWGGPRSGSNCFKIPPYLRLGGRPYTLLNRLAAPEEMVPRLVFSAEVDMVLSPYISLEVRNSLRCSNGGLIGKENALSMYSWQDMTSSELLECLLETGPLSPEQYETLPFHYICTLLMNFYDPFVLAMVIEMDPSRFGVVRPAMVPMEWIDGLRAHMRQKWSVRWCGHSYTLNNSKNPGRKMTGLKSMGECNI